MSSPAPSPPVATVGDLVHRLAVHDAARAVITAPGQPAMTAGELWALLGEVSAALRAVGVRRTDTVALVTANGPSAATAFLATSACAACAPLNPVYGAAEFRFYLEDLGARALLVDPALASPAEAVARELGVPVLYLQRTGGAPAGAFVVAPADPVDPAAQGTAAPAATPTGDDVALVLHTSGTTARPKVVPLAHANLCASAGHIATTLALTADDHCLNVMPLFHIHGLVAAVLASLHAGARITCLGGLDPASFVDALGRERATWYTAVPTMHQAILDAVDAKPDGARGHALRFVRSSSAALPPAVLRRLETSFGVPVIEAYGMTEAAHQMASNPLPPDARKPGSVGRAAGPAVAIMDDAGALLPRGVTGEVVVRGPNVTHGYAANPEANARAFTHGWFRTGDQGYLDEDDYLFLTGRLKELINRGGEKVSPLEVDAVLLEHPAVAQAVCFAVPHPSLGEEVAAAVVVRAGAMVDADELRRFAAGQLARFKVPRLVRFVASLPKGATGKVQRIGLAERLGVTAADLVADGGVLGPSVAPRTPLEEIVASVWGAALARERVGVEDDFYALGGTSLAAQRIALRLEELLQLQLPVARLLAGGATGVADGATGPSSVTVAGTAAMLATMLDEAPPAGGAARR